VTSGDLASRYHEILARIRVCTSRPVTLLAVSKKQPVSAIAELYRLGHRDFGENYVQELVEKAVELEKLGCTGIRWHFIGHLQTNKVKAVIPHVHSIHSVDSSKLSLEIAKRWRDSGRGVSTGARLPVFAEVNLDHEPGKAGATPETTAALCSWIAAERELELLGLMAIPAAAHSDEESRAAFARLRELELKCRPYSQGQLSMGMSGDFELALSEGATHIRVGTALFGARG
jgi:pyridoxal phosphate enzyme (YggS family)